jgi:hypothetical protein
VLEPPVGPAPSDHEQLIEYLESDQLVRERARPVGPAHLSRPAAAGLWALGVFAVVTAAMVIYTFVAQL